MKKTILIAAMALISLFAVSCGNANENKQSPTPAAQTAQAQGDKNAYSQIPDGAEKALGVAAQRSESAFATAGNCSYGYKGTAEVKGSQCYCFSVFDTDKESTLYVGDIAVTADGDKVFSSKAGKDDYSELNEPAKKESWSEKSTPAFTK